MASHMPLPFLVLPNLCAGLGVVAHGLASFTSRVSAFCFANYVSIHVGQQ